MNIEFDVTLQCNFSCVNCNRHSNFNDLSSPLTGGKDNSVGLDLYERTDITIEQTKKFIEEVKENGTIERIHLIGGEPLVHPQMDKICDLMREELWGEYVREILIISNLHPKMLKKGTLDTPEEILKYVPSPELEIAYEHSLLTTSIPINVIRKILSESSKNGIHRDNMFELASQIRFSDPNFSGEVSLSDMLPKVSTFHGIPVINYKPLSAKHEEHRCTLVAPNDTGQDMNDKCNFPRHCGINYTFDGYWPCSNGSAIARLFKLEEKYRRDKLPKSEADWDGVNKDGIADTKSKGMWDLCKLCQVSAKIPMNEKDYGRPISISYRKALGLEGTSSTQDYIVKGHKKKLAPNPEFVNRTGESDD
tara:strand:- start:481 stop:1572 length:1092 start_codon:yes stop_codon:yes gene_type:complete